MAIGTSAPEDRDTAVAVAEVDPPRRRAEIGVCGTTTRGQGYCGGRVARSGWRRRGDARTVGGEVPLDPTLPALLGLAMYPGLEHRELAGGFGFSAIESPAAIVDGWPTGELRLREARTGDLPLPLRDEEEKGPPKHPHSFVRETSVRIARDADGRVDLDRVEIGVVSGIWVRSRPNLGEPFELSFGVGRREENWVWRNLEHVQARLFSPLALFPLGLSNTDQDDDGKVKGQASALFGLGGEVLWRPVGPLLGHLRVSAEGRTARRFANDTTNNVRHEGIAQAEAGLGARIGDRALLVAAWAEGIAQVDPYDGGEARYEVDRRWWAGGVRVAWRWYDKAKPKGEKPPDLDALFERLGQEIEGEPPAPVVPAPVVPEPEPEPEPVPPEPGPAPAPPKQGPSPD